ncbi:LacI family transcriptional regulator [Homoserinimonas aerilata]|uniref:LacI family transcriptional regulator n=1 Tax=Homoserinimonas aerilata TaxID=1162970 RepID=A0A542YIE4_9MICO|nr:LacI family DNA-binding transcriptional regulator [Homoserinimonas aerilata]TQL47842.1 LacI family transcriptional regulator [Homoserinimonas aerilata]
MTIGNEQGGTVATLRDVAALAGVSLATASRVINGSTQVTTASVAAVSSAVAKLNYVPNRAARSLARRKTHMIAMVIPEQTSKFFSDPYFAAVIQGAAMRVSSTDYTLTLLIESDADPQKTMRFLEGGNVDGALILARHSRDASYVELSRSLPVVFGVRPLIDDGSEHYVVDVDNVEAAAKATQHLVDRGCRRIATISPPLDTSAGIDRSAGWRHTLRDAGLDAAQLEEGDFTPAGGAAAMRRMLERGPLPDGLMAASAQMASGALGVLKEHGLTVPGDIAVATIDDNYFSTNSSPPLTTVDLATDTKGAIMAETLLDLIEGRPVKPLTTIETRLIVRDSA